MKQCGKCQMVWEDNFQHCGRCGGQLFGRFEERFQPPPASSGPTAGQFVVIFVIASVAFILYVMVFSSGGKTSVDPETSIVFADPNRQTMCLTADYFRQYQGDVPTDEAGIIRLIASGRAIPVKESDLLKVRSVSGEFSIVVRVDRSKPEESCAILSSHLKYGATP